MSDLRGAVWENNAAREGRWPTFRWQKITTIWHPSAGPFCGLLSLHPAIRVDDRCLIGQHLNRVKIKMVNAGGAAVTRARVGKCALAKWRMAKAKTGNGEAHRKKSVEPLSAIRYFPIRFPCSPFGMSLSNRGSHVSQAQAATETQHVRL